MTITTDQYRNLSATMQAMTAAPADNDEFVIVSLHVHPISQIQSGLATSSEVTALNNQLPSEAF